MGRPVKAPCYSGLFFGNEHARLLVPCDAAAHARSDGTAVEPTIY
jgi:hypothetical protein